MTPLPNSRGECNLVMKCKFCKQQSSVDILNECAFEFPIEKEGDDENKEGVREGSKKHVMMSMECRGLVPVEWVKQDGFNVSCQGGQVFTECDLSEDWFEYDDGAKCPCSITEITHLFIKI